MLPLIPLDCVRPIRMASLLSWAPMLLLAIPLNAQAIAGAGATFPAPLYAKWIAAFEARFPGQHLEYRPTGSEEGIRLLKNGAVQFAGTDFPIEDRDYLQLPAAVGAVVPIYNLPGVFAELRLTPLTLASIFLGKIRQWNDPALQASNRGVKLPGQKIIVVHRSDGSGTTFVWSDYLCKISPEWAQHGGRGSSLQWPIGEPAMGNDGVSERVQQTAGSIGYVELIYAVQHHLAMGAVQNSTGKFIHADVPSLKAATRSLQVPDDFSVSITNPSEADAYPICSFTWLIVRRSAKEAPLDDPLHRFLSWALSSGQAQASALGYVPLPKNLADRELETLEREMGKPGRPDK